MREFLDVIEKHLCSLEKLGECVNQRIFVSMIRSKLPEVVLYQLEFNKGSHSEWGIDNLREHLHNYVKACEKANKRKDGRDAVRSSSFQNSQYSRSQDGANTITRPRFSNGNAARPHRVAETLMVNNKTQTEPPRSANECKYCSKKHWSDECTKYKTLGERKNKKKKGSCFRCLMFGHKAVECKSNISCVYSGEYNKHHRSLCPNDLKRNNKQSV